VISLLRRLPGLRSMRSAWAALRPGLPRASVDRGRALFGLTTWSPARAWSSQVRLSRPHRHQPGHR